MRTRLRFVAFFLLAALVARPAHSQDRPPRSGGDLTTLSLEDLMSVDVSVTSAARRSQRLNDVASAIYVLTADDIRRSGARSIPDALRLVPGMQVAQMDADKWGVSSRGFNGRFSNKLLVLMDGRTIYTPLFSGVIWELHQALPEDIERIEVIRGPGASLWGSNAVNGVINIITKSATATQGGLATAGAGTHDRGFGSLRSATAPTTAPRSRARIAPPSPATTKARRRLASTTAASGFASTRRKARTPTT